MTDAADDIEGLEALPTEELRHRAFAKAEHAHDLRFFWDLVRHLPSSVAIEGEDGSSGAIAGTLAELVEMGRQLMGKDLGTSETLVREHFIAYLRS